MDSNEKESKNIRGRGGKRPNSGRPAGSPNKITRPLKEAAAMEGDACLETLVQLRDNGASEQVRLQAATAILDRGFGRPRQEITVEDNSFNIVINRGLVSDQQSSPVLIEGEDDDSQGRLDAKP